MNMEHKDEAEFDIYKPAAKVTFQHSIPVQLDVRSGLGITFFR